MGEMGVMRASLKRDSDRVGYRREIRVSDCGVDVKFRARDCRSKFFQRAMTFLCGSI